MKQVESFLLKNGFEEINQNIYKNDLCSIEITSDLDENLNKYQCYKITYIDKNNYSCDMWSNDLNIYWLIGMLTYYGLMDKNYNQ